jgi:hypothetical protein
MTTQQMKIARVQRTLAWLEADMPQLSTRFRDLSAERQVQAKCFAASVIDCTRAELERLLAELPSYECDSPPCEPAD